MQGLLRRILALWVRATLRPEDAAARLNGRTVPICYVLERVSASDLAVLQNLCVRDRLPRPGRRLLARQLRSARSSLALTRAVGFWRSRDDRRPPELLLNLINALRTDLSLDVSLVPAAVYWGRAPQRERSLIRLLVSEDWVIASRVRRVITVIFNGRNTTVQLGDPISLRSLLGTEADTRVSARRVSRLLRTQLSRLRTALIGPDLSHRRTIVAEVLRTRAVRAAVAQEVREQDQSTRRSVLLEARRYANEIAANYSHTFVSLMAMGLAKLWNRLYDGVEFEHLDRLEQLAQGNEIIYVPCHRSHMDYLLLSYAIYQHGYAVPHIAAGLNLNLPIVGRFLRKGGAFFLRRSLRGSSLYTVVFMKYLATMMARGHSIEYFIEGGRSRTGRLRPPMGGMLAMTVRSYLREPRRPLVFIPVYFGYERIVEGSTYVGELSGRPKEKESVLGLLRMIGKLRQRFGRVHVNLGEPLYLDALIDQFRPGWRQEEFDDQNRAPWVRALVEELALRIMRRINAAATVTPINLLAMALLGTQRQAMLETDLISQIEAMLAVLRAVPYSNLVSLSTQSAPEMIKYGLELNVITRENQRAGHIVRMSPEHAVLATYYRNNVLHLFAMPSLIACCFLSNSMMRTEDVLRLASRIYPYIAAELFLRWSEDEVPAVVAELLAAMAQLGLLVREGDLWHRPAPVSAAAMHLSLLAQSTIQTIERYYLAIALLIRSGSGAITQKLLEENCELMAQRMTALYGLNSPEFFDPSLFESFIDLLRSRDVVRTDEAGRLTFDEVLLRVEADAQLVLSEQIRHSILQVTHS
ncbi:MAG TPA: glycerol-3-phosphate 1-O-acyltransferase PlsB [Steroidobacteraceae bacterium]|jgi:glycerol-3-phosphate O-acyltransferase|nr:glycerol-3-phosphate 1-O-acyltransferase PlsB [Steroidobacteraceae bacterium]